MRHLYTHGIPHGSFNPAPTGQGYLAIRRHISDPIAIVWHPRANLFHSSKGQQSGQGWVGDTGLPYLAITLLTPSCVKGLDFSQPTLISTANHDREALTTLVKTSN